MFRTKRIYEPAADEDGTRVLVDRIWPRGVRKADAAVDHWLKDISPSPELRKWFDHDPAKFEKFSARYRGELDQAPEAIRQLHDLSAQGTVTLLYGARDSEHNQARVLAEYLEHHS